jgi:hypothetical protein
MTLRLHHAKEPVRFIALILAGSLLAGCAGRPAGVLMPVDASVPNAARVDFSPPTNASAARPCPNTALSSFGIIASLA